MNVKLFVALLRFWVILTDLFTHTHLKKSVSFCVGCGGARGGGGGGGNVM